VSGQLHTPAALPPGEEPPLPSTHWIWDWVVPRTGLVDVEGREIFPLPGFELRPLGRPAIASRYTDYAIPVPNITVNIFKEMLLVNLFLNSTTSVKLIVFHWHVSEEGPQGVETCKAIHPISSLYTFLTLDSLLFHSPSFDLSPKQFSPAFPTVLL
jgi:hypothetical protein